jgi:hypothetical protein
VTGEAQKNLRSAAKDTEAGHSVCHLTHFTCGTRCAPADPPDLTKAKRSKA